jgi:uncharacterized protein YggE
MCRTRLIILLAVLAGAAGLPAQTAGTIQALGAASLSVQPDQALLTVSVSTDGATAQQAAQLNATQTNAVLNALKQVLGSSGSIQTIGYSEYPRYNSGTNPSIIGYTAANTVQATTYDLTLPGALIDAASQSGASTIGGLTFGLRDPDPTKQQALTAAAKQALAHASAIAAGLGAKAGPVVSAQESAATSPVVLGVASSVSTPIQTGSVTVTANVTVTVQLQ